MSPARTLSCRWTALEPHTSRVTLSGDLDHDTADTLPRETGRYLDAHPELRRLHLDCANLEFCDSSGLSALLMVGRLIRDADAGLSLDNRRPALQRLLEVTGTLDFLTGHPTPHREQLLDP